MSTAQPIFAPDAVHELAASLFPAGVALAVSFPWEPAEGLFVEERDSLVRPTDKRLAEFAAGRRAAHAAMVNLGVAQAPILQAADRAPVWPDNLAGSISHTDTICVAALGHSTQFASLAVDIEDDAGLPDDVLSEVCTAVELAWLSVQPPKSRGRLARLIFSAKECAYKLQYPLTGELLEFDAFEVTPDLQTGQFEATLTRDVGRFEQRQQFAGRFGFGAGCILTGMTISSSALD